MIGARDRVELAPDVRLDGRLLLDPVRGSRIELNASAVVALAESTPARMAQAVAARFAVGAERAEGDAKALCAALNAALLLNLRAPLAVRIVRWAALALALAPVRRLPPWPPTRYRLATTSVPRALVTTAVGCAGPAALVAALAALPFVVIGIWQLGAATAGAAAVGLVLHEAAHAAALRGAPAALVVRGLRVSVLHGVADPSKRARVAAAGPACVAALAGVAAAVATATDAAALAAAAIVLAPHALALTLVGADGRTLCAAS